MRQITITGFLAADAEVKMSRQGNAYLSFRMANNEYNEDKTHWYNVTCANIPFYVNMAKHFKKGSSVIVTGEYNDDIYQTKTGSCEISRNIRAVSIHFNSSGRQTNEEKQPTADVTVAKPSERVTTEVNMGSFKPQTSAPSTPKVTVADSDDDDLPF